MDVNATYPCTFYIYFYTLTKSFLNCRERKQIKLRSNSFLLAPLKCCLHTIVLPVSFSINDNDVCVAVEFFSLS